MKWITLALLAAIIRGVLFCFNLDNALSSSVELVTPTTSFKRLSEGLYLLKQEISPYTGSVFLQPPLLLVPFLFPSYITQVFDSKQFIGITLNLADKVWSRIIFISLDLLITMMLYHLAKHVAEKRKRNSKLPESKDTSIADNLPHIVAAAYIFNPIMIASCVSLSTVIFNNFALCGALYFAVAKNDIMMSTFFIGLASYLTLYPVIVLVGIIVIFLNHNAESPNCHSSLKIILKTCAWFLIWISAFLLLSFELTGRDWQFVYNSYIYPMMVMDLTPNWGNFWYFFTEVFDYFRPFFLFVFHIHILIYVFPLTLRLKYDGLFLSLMLIGITSLFKAYPTFGDSFFYFTLFLLYTFHLSSYMRFGFFVSALVLFSMVLGPVFYNSWIYKGTGNANFFYFLTLVYLLGQILLLIEFLVARMKAEFYARRIKTKQE